MAAKEQLKYPQAYLAQGNGDLMQVTDFTISTSNKGKQQHTLRRPQAGVVKGKPETKVTFNFAIDEEGIERPYIEDVLDGTIRQLRAKLPGGKTIAIDGMYTDCNLDGPLEDATKGSCTFVGKISR